MTVQALMLRLRFRAKQVGIRACTPQALQQRPAGRRADIASIQPVAGHAWRAEHLAVVGQALISVPSCCLESPIAYYGAKFVWQIAATP